MTEYLFSGTLGDAFIALCKLHDSCIHSPCTLRRMCRHPGADRKIAEITTLFENIRYELDYLHFDTIDAMRDFAFAHAECYINIFHDGDGRGTEPNDPRGIRFNPYPQLHLNKQRLTPRRWAVGINLNSGSRAENQRRVSVDWVIALSRELVRSDQIGLIVLGTGAGFTAEELGRLSRLPDTVVNLVGVHGLIEGMNCVASLDFLVSPEGLLTFLALSQCVPTLVLYEEPSALLRMPPVWRDMAVCVRPHVMERGTQRERWTAFPTRQTASLILARFDPEKA